jgi:two-component system KDP operon response regulator KdpE
VHAIFRRSGKEAMPPTQYDFGDGYLEIDFETHRISVAGKEERLTPIEFKLLRELVLNAGRGLSNRYLLETVWGPQYADDTSLLYTHISHLRDKIEPDRRHPVYIVTDAWLGYSFMPRSLWPRRRSPAPDSPPAPDYQI